MSYDPKVIIIILNLNGLDDTLECLESVYKLEYLNFEVIVVDNGSSDNSVNIIEKRYPQVILIKNEENLGFTGGNNIGIQVSLRRGAEYIWLLNNDTVVEPQSLSKLVDSAKSNKYVGLLSPMVYYYDQPDAIQFCGCYADPERFRFNNLRDPGMLKEKQSDKYQIQWGTALLIKRSVINDIGYLNDKYFAYFEDCEYSIRARKFGYKSMVQPEAKVYHKESRSTGSKKSPMQVYLRVRNEHFFWMDIVKRFRKIKYFRQFFMNTISYTGTLRKEHYYDAAEACLNGAWAGIRGIGGPKNESIKLPRLIRQVILWQPFFLAHLLRGNFSYIASEVIKRLSFKRKEL